MEGDASTLLAMHVQSLQALVHRGRAQGDSLVNPTAFELLTELLAALSAAPSVRSLRCSVGGGTVGTRSARLMHTVPLTSSHNPPPLASQRGGWLRPLPPPSHHIPSLSRPSFCRMLTTPPSLHFPPASVSTRVCP